MRIGSLVPRPLLVVWVLGAVYSLALLSHGWVPHDEGLLGQSAQRVLAGELPHRDFIEPYGGGLSYLHALAFAVIGVDLFSLRLVLWAAFVCTIPALYYVATRFVSASAAAVAVALSVAWSVPNYPASLPSWYNLFLAVVGTAALLRFAETGQRRWLAAAGVAAGVSFVIKLAGLYFVAAALLFLVFYEQETSPTSSDSGTSFYRVFVTGALAAFVTGLAALWAGRPGERVFVHFVLPGATLAGLLVWNERGRPSGVRGRRFMALSRLCGTFLAGAAVPVAVLLTPFIVQGAVGDVWSGLFVRPAARLASAAMEPPSLLLSAFAALPLVLVFAAGSPPRLRHPAFGVLAVVAVAAGLASVPGDSFVYQWAWLSARPLVPILTLAGAWLLVAREGRELEGLRRQQLFLLLAVTAMVSLVQFPFSAPVYFLYVAPLVVLTAAAILAVVPGTSRATAVTVSAFYCAFAVFFLNGTSVRSMGQSFAGREVVPLGLPRGSIRVPRPDSTTYVRLAAVVAAHANSSYIYAGPDCPQVYFLTGRTNPTPTLFEFLDPASASADNVLRAITERNVNLAVVNRRPEFSGAMDPALNAALARLFSDSVRIGEFTVRWRS